MCICTTAAKLSSDFFKHFQRSRPGQKAPEVNDRK
jgi:hypothetical protein